MESTIRDRLISDILAVIRDWFQKHSWLGSIAIDGLRTPLENLLTSREQLTSGEWVPVENGLPGREREVPLVVMVGERRQWVKAIYAEHGTLEIGDDQELFAGCVTAENGCVYVPQGWYVIDGYQETCHPVSGIPVAWLDLTFPYDIVS
jgi:hypothetical protein